MPSHTPKKPKFKLHNFTFPTDLSWKTKKNLDAGEAVKSPEPTALASSCVPNSDPVAGDSHNNRALPQSQERICEPREKGENMDAESSAASEICTKIPAKQGAASSQTAIAEEANTKKRKGRKRMMTELEEPDKKLRVRIQLTEHEILQDLLLMTGRRPSRTTKMRPKDVQKKIDRLFPGLHLPPISTDSYINRLTMRTGCCTILL